MQIQGNDLKLRISNLAQEVLADSAIGLVYITKQEALNALLDEHFYEARFSIHRGSKWVTIWKMY